MKRRLTYTYTFLSPSLPPFLPQFLGPLVHATISLQKALPKYRYNFPSAPAKDTADFVLRATSAAAAGPLPLMTGAAAAAVAAARGKGMMEVEGGAGKEEEERGKKGGEVRLFVAATPFVVPLAKFLNRFVAEQECSDQVGREERRGRGTDGEGCRMIMFFSLSLILPN